MTINTIPNNPVNINRNNRADFFKALFEDPIKDKGHFIEVRQICRDKKQKPLKPQQYFSSIDALLTELNKPQPVGVDLYFGVHTRNKQSGKAEDVDTVACLYADIDFKDVAKADAQILIKKNKFSIVVETGHGFHVYALLKTPLLLADHGAEYDAINEAYQKALCSDNVDDHPRILRIPDTINYKHSDKPVQCKIIWADYNQRFDLSDFSYLKISPKVEVTPSIQSPSADKAIQEGGRNVYLTKVGGVLRQKGFGEKTILNALIDENREKCSPPLAESEVRTIAHSVAQYESGNKSVAENLTDAGFDSLTEKSTADELKTVLEVLGGNTTHLDKLTRVSVRAEAVKRLKDLKVESPSRLVDAALIPSDQNSSVSSGPGKAVYFEEIEPWPDPVNGAELLDEFSALFKRFVILPQSGETVLALWALYTYVFDAFDVAPYLILVSPEKRCGKTRTLELLFIACRRPYAFSNLTTAIAFRFVETYHPTLLVDEADRFLAKNQELLGILNAGYRKGVVIPRCVGDNHEIKTFDPFGPKAIASIGALADTLEDRAIVINMKRRAEGEIIDSFTQEKVRAEYLDQRRKAARWAADNIERMKGCLPAAPTGLNDREKDNWRPLLSVAEVCGGRWPEIAFNAALAFSTSADEKDSARVILLSDLKSLFEMLNTERLSSEDIVKALGEMEERQWPEWKNGKPITARQIAQLLKRFDIKPKQLWIGDKKRGYELEDFKDAFNRYLPQSNVTDTQNSLFQAVGAVDPNSDAEWAHICKAVDSPFEMVTESFSTGLGHSPTDSQKTSELNNGKPSTSSTGSKQKDLTYFVQLAMAGADASLKQQLIDSWDQEVEGEI